MADEPSTPDPQPETDPTPEPEVVETPAGDDKLPPEIKSILDKERRAARDSARTAKKAETALAAATTELEQFRQAQMTEQEKAVAAARAEGVAEGRTAGNQALVRAAVISAAVGKVANPGHAFAILTDQGALRGIEVNETGEVDNDAIKTAIDSLVEADPQLAVTAPVRDPQFGNRQPATGTPPNTDAAFDAFLRAARGR